MHKSNAVTVFKYCNSLIYTDPLPKTCTWLVLQCECYWFRCTDENGDTVLLATQFVMINEWADQTDIGT